MRAESVLGTDEHADADQQETSGQQRPPRRPAGPKPRKSDGEPADIDRQQWQQGEPGDGIGEGPLLPGGPEVGAPHRTARPEPRRPARRRRERGTRRTPGRRPSPAWSPADRGASRSGAGKRPPAPRADDSPPPPAGRNGTLAPLFRWGKKSAAEAASRTIHHRRAGVRRSAAVTIAYGAKMMAARRPGNCSRTSALAPTKQPPNTRATVAANRVLDDAASRVPMNEPSVRRRAEPTAMGKGNQAVFDSARRAWNWLSARIGSIGGRPGDPWRGRERPTGGGEQPAATLAEIVFAIAGGDLPLGVLHQAAARRAVREPQRVARLVDGDLGQPLACVGRDPAISFDTEIRR